MNYQEVQRLETEKHDLIFDGQQRLEQGLAVQDELDALRSKLDKVNQPLSLCIYSGVDARGRGSGRGDEAYKEKVVGLGGAYALRSKQDKVGQSLPSESSFSEGRFIRKVSG